MQSHKSLPRGSIRAGGLYAFLKIGPLRISSGLPYLCQETLNTVTFTFSCQHLAPLPPTTISSAYLNTTLQMHTANHVWGANNK